MPHSPPHLGQGQSRAPPPHSSHCVLYCPSDQSAPQEKHFKLLSMVTPIHLLHDSDGYCKALTSKTTVYRNRPPYWTSAPLNSNLHSRSYGRIKQVEKKVRDISRFLFRPVIKLPLKIGERILEVCIMYFLRKRERLARGRILKFHGLFFLFAIPPCQQRHKMFLIG